MPKLTLLIILIFLTSKTFACSCLPPTTFCESNAGLNGNLRADIILIGKGFKDSQGKSRINVQHVLSGEVDTDNIEMVGTSCDLFSSPIDTEKYLFALNKCGDFYCFNLCAVGFLKIEGNEVVGKIAPEIDRLKLDELGEMICAIAFESLSNKIEIFPNPTPDIIKFKNTGDQFTFNDLQMRIFDSSGRLVHTSKNTSSILPDDSWEINIKDLTNGVYIVQLYTPFQNVIKKVVKI